MIYPSEYRLGNIISWNPALKDPAITLPVLNIEIAAILPDKIGYISPNIEHRVEYFEDGPVLKNIAFRGVEELQPLPLTADIVQKAGFVESRLDLSNEDGTCSFIYTDGGIHYIEDEHRSHYKCSYLHQLQNIFYNLKGMELDVTGISAMG